MSRAGRPEGRHCCREGWAALRMVREAVEAHIPAGALPAREHTGISPLDEGEALAKAITTIALRRDHTATANVGPKEARTRAKTGKPWSDTDDSDLLDYDEQRVMLDQVAALLGRELHEIAARLEQLKPKAS
jgi:hypothetical protein